MREGTGQEMQWVCGTEAGHASLKGCDGTSQRRMMQDESGSKNISKILCSSKLFV